MGDVLVGQVTASDFSRKDVAPKKMDISLGKTTHLQAGVPHNLQSAEGCAGTALL